MWSGEQASRAAIETLIESYYDHELDDEDPRERLIAAIQDAHEAVLARSRALAGQSIGTTLVGVVVLLSGRLVLFNVGDSRLYRVRRNSIEQLTDDQSAIDPAVDGGDRAKLTAYIGQPRPIVPQIAEHPLQPGDTLVACSDGLWGLVEAAEIASLVRASAPDSAVGHLIEQVYANGARDNVTVMLIQYGNRPGKNRLMLALLIAAVIVAAVVVANGLRQSAATTNPAAADPVAATAEIAPTITESAPPTDENAGLLIVRTPTPNDG